MPRFPREFFGRLDDEQLVDDGIDCKRLHPSENVLDFDNSLASRGDHEFSLQERLRFRLVRFEVVGEKIR